MKLPVIILTILFASCATMNNIPDHQEQARLECFIVEKNHRTILKLITVTGKEVIWYASGTGIGQSKWQEGDKYSVHFNVKGQVVRVTKNY